MNSNKFAVLFSIVFSIVLMGCASFPVCRHNIGRDYLWALEQGYSDPRIAVYPNNDLIWDGHAQVQVIDGKKVRWITETMGLLHLTETPDERPTGTITVFTMSQYEEWLRQGCGKGKCNYVIAAPLSMSTTAPGKN